MNVFRAATVRTGLAVLVIAFKAPRADEVASTPWAAAGGTNIRHAIDEVVFARWLVERVNFGIRGNVVEWDGGHWGGGGGK